MPVLADQGIPNFYRTIQSRDLARDFQFRVLQLGANNIDQQFGPSSLVLLRSASVPGRNIVNQPVPFMGMQFNIPGAATYPGSDAWTATFLLPQNYSIQSVFEAWTRAIFEDQISTGDYTIPSPASVLTLGLLNNAGDIVRLYNLIGVWCVGPDAVPYNLGGSGTPLEFNVTLAYQYYQIVNNAAGFSTTTANNTGRNNIAESRVVPNSFTNIGPLS